MLAIVSWYCSCLFPSPGTVKWSLLLHHFVVCNVLHDIYGIYLLVAYIVYSYFVFYSYLISGLIKFAMVTVCHLSCVK